MHKQDALPRGHYYAGEVGQLAGVSGKKIGQWARRGYIRSSQSTTVPLVYSYQDVGEAMFVHELEDRGLAPAAIGEAVATLRETIGTEWPLQITPLYVAGSRTIATRQGRQYVNAASGHPMLAKMDLERIALDLSRGGWAVREIRPRLRNIEVNPDRLSGQPTIRGRRVAAKTVALMAKTPEGLDELRLGYDLTPGQIKDATRWWDQVQRYEAAA